MPPVPGELIMFLDLCADYDIPISQITIEDLITEVDTII